MRKRLNELSMYVYILCVVWTVSLPPLLPSCDQPLGLQDGRIPDSAITASGSYRERSRPELSRLNLVTLDSRNRFTGAWCQKKSRSQWIQVDFGKTVNVTHVATQGKVDLDFWVTSYCLDYRTTSGQLYWYSGQTGIVVSMEVKKKEEIVCMYVTLVHVRAYVHGLGACASE